MDETTNFFTLWRDPYDLTDNNCGTFAADVINQDECVDDPYIYDPTPANIVVDETTNFFILGFEYLN